MPVTKGQRNTELEEAVQHGNQASGWGCCGFLSFWLFLTLRFDYWKENGAEGNKKATDSLGQKGGEVHSYCMAESRGGSFRWTQGRKARRGRNDVSFKGS